MKSSRSDMKFRNQVFLFSELVKRDFKKKYKNTFLGFAWSMLSPLLSLAVMSVVFAHFFGRNTEHYTIYLFAGNILFSYFNDATNGGMASLAANADIFTRINVPKYLFLLSRGVCSMINFLLTLIIFSVFCIFDGISPSLAMLTLPLPFITLSVFNVGVGLFMSCLFVFFRDMQYLWSIFTMLLMYLSAIFYTTDTLPPWLAELLLLNPVYLHIKYVRTIIIDGSFAPLSMNILAISYAAAALSAGVILYNKSKHKFAYYV